MSRTIRIIENHYYWKERAIDIGGSDFIAPSTDIYDGETRYYKANSDWSRVIEGLVSWLAEPSAWKDEQDFLIAEQNILKFIEGVEIGEVIMLTQEELIEVVCKGMECHTDELARRWLLAQSGNIRGGASVSPDSDSIVIDNSFGGQLPQFETDEEARNGGMFAVATQLKKLYDSTSSYIDNAYSNSLISSLITTLLGNPIGAITGIDALIADYVLDYATEQITVPNVNTLTEFFYCEGIQDGFLAWLDSLTLTEAQIDYHLRFFSIISQSTLNRWYESGLATPRSNYLNYSCFIRPPLFAIFDDYDNSEQQVAVDSLDGLTNRLYRIKITGTMSNATESWDGAYLVNNSTGVTTRSNPAKFGLYKGGTLKISAIVPPQIAYSEQGYSFIVSGSMDGSFGPNARLQLGTTLAGKNFTSGSIRMDIIDLGASS